jgi:predicted TIM-barrel enzyme
MNYATERLLAAAEASLLAWENEEDSVREEHREVIEELDQAIIYFTVHGSKPQPQEQANA